MTLSILIPSLFERNEIREKLINQLKAQCGELLEEGFSGIAGMVLYKYIFTDVEILILLDNRQTSIGAKRNLLMYLSNGDYLAFIDCDDRISPNYISLLMAAIETKPDCCSLNGIYKRHGKRAKLFKHSIDYNGWYEKDRVLFRFINHLNCVRADIAKQMVFPEHNNGEDRAYSIQLQESGLLKTEYKIDEILYYYDYIPKVR